jgi:hypothetical protein
MPGYVLTADTIATCPHGGQVTFSPSQTSVAILGAQALLVTDPASITGCAFTIGPTPSPCLSVQWIAATGSVRATVNSTSLVLTTTVGLCVSGAQAPQGPIVLSSYQQKVRAA